jgi:hypothetical protein
MESAEDCLEIVRISAQLRLFDGESYQRRYVAPEGVPLGPGVYVAQWPPGIALRRFDERVIYHGPFASQERARTVLDSLKQAMGAMQELELTDNG